MSGRRNADDIARLERIEIARALGRILEVLGDLAAEPTPVVPAALWDALHEAVSELGDLAAIRQAVTDGTPITPRPGPESINGTDRTVIETAINILLAPVRQDPELPEALASRGLSGRQLRFKLDVLNQLYADYVAHGRAPAIPKNDVGWIRSTARRAGRFLAASAKFVDSLSGVVPGLGVLKAPSEICSLLAVTSDLGDAVS